MNHLWVESVVYFSSCFLVILHCFLPCLIIFFKWNTWHWLWKGVEALDNFYLQREFHFPLAVRKSFGRSPCSSYGGSRLMGVAYLWFVFTPRIIQQGGNLNGKAGGLYQVPFSLHSKLQFLSLQQKGNSWLTLFAASHLLDVSVSHSANAQLRPL